MVIKIDRANERNIKVFYKIKILLKDVANIFISLLRIIRNPIALRKNILPINNKNTMLILGNGPSLKEFLETDREDTLDSDIFAVNKFCLSEAYTQVKPTHYILVDSDFFFDDTDSAILEMKKNVLSKFEHETDWDMNLFLPRNDKSQIIAQQIMQHNSKIKVFYFNAYTIDGPSFFRNYMYKRGVGMPFVGNVLVSANILSINMNYKNIKIFGAEQSIHLQGRVNQNNEVVVGYTYFNGHNSDVVLKNDLDPSKPQTYHEFLTHWRDTFASYHLVESYAQYRKCKIINMTEDSYIDAFEKKIF